MNDSTTGNTNTDILNDKIQLAHRELQAIHFSMGKALREARLSAVTIAALNARQQAAEDNLAALLTAIG